MREVNLPLPNLITSSCKAKAVLLRVPKSPLMVQTVPERYWSKIRFFPLSVSKCGLQTSQKKGKSVGELCMHYLCGPQELDGSLPYFLQRTRPGQPEQMQKSLFTQSLRAVPVQV